MDSSTEDNDVKMDTITDRNPSPPPELLQHSEEMLPDRVGDSVFSKHWLFKTLITIVETVNQEVMEDTVETSDKEETPSSDIHELDSKLEDDACVLWDMSVNSDVAHFLQEFKIFEIFLEVIDKTKSPRLLEIVVGILGNLASFDDLCQDMSNSIVLLKSLVSLTGSSDAPTIVQVLRLIHTGVVNENTADIWLGILRAELSFMSNMSFILENSLNAEVLKGSLQLLYYILDNEQEACAEWVTKDHAKSIVAAGRQLLTLSEFRTIDELWLLLNLMCQHDANVVAISNHYDELYPVYLAYLSRLCEYNYNSLPPMERVAAIAAYFTTLATLLQQSSDRAAALKTDKGYMKYVESLFNSVTEVLQKGCIILKGGSPEPGQEQDSGPAPASCNGDSAARNKLTQSISIHEDDYNSLFILKETLIEICSIILPSVLSAKLIYI